jgi:hypothetical protein
MIGCSNEYQPLMPKISAVKSCEMKIFIAVKSMLQANADRRRSRLVHTVFQFKSQDQLSRDFTHGIDVRGSDIFLQQIFWYRMQVVGLNKRRLLAPPQNASTGMTPQIEDIDRLRPTIFFKKVYTICKFFFTIESRVFTKP